MDNKITTYRLYALPTTLESVVIATQERFARATATPAPGYVLIYTDGPQPEGSHHITEEQKHLLTEADMRWLAECGATILLETAEQQEPDYMNELAERMAALEEALKQTKAELEQKGG